MAETKKSNSGAAQITAANPMKSWFPMIAIIVVAFIAHFIFYSTSGFSNPANFSEGVETYNAHKAWVKGGEKGEEPGDYLMGHPMHEPGYRYFQGIVRKGGFVIPIGMTLFLVLVVFSVERRITVFKAKGKGSIDVFVKKIRMMLGKGNIDNALAECDRQQGSVANVVKAGLRKYKEVENMNIEKEKQKLAIHGEIEEATMLELPMLEKNLSILSTIAALGTLVGLIGTVIGMIKAFSALGSGGSGVNAAELSVGISEALVNTAIGITTSAFAVLAYNFFTTQIDGMTYAMDEAGYSIVQAFDVQH